MVSGVYKITSPSGKFYIGSSKNIKRRFIEHKCKLRKQTHPNHILQNACNKYGLDSLIFETIETCCSAMRIENEQKWIDELKPKYNLSNSAKNAMCDPNVAIKVAVKLKGRKATSEQRLKMSVVSKGKKKSYTHRINISLGQHKRVKCIELDLIFNSIQEASKQTGCVKSSISQVCNGKRNHTKNLTFKFVGQEI